MKTKRSLSSKFLVTVMLLFVVVGYNGCKKDPPEPVSSKTETSSAANPDQLKEIFYRNKFDQKLISQLSDTVKIVWLPDWKKAGTRVKDSTTYTYVPLVPSMKGSLASIQVHAMNQKQFLIIRNGKEFLRATYISKDTIKRNQQTSEFKLANFNGTLFLDNLETSQRFKYKFQNGTYIRTAPPAKNISGTKTNSDIQVMGWQTECHTEYVCGFAAYCGPGVYIYLDETGNCQPPWGPPSNEYSGCYDDVWSFSYSEPFDVCESIYVPDPPPPPGNGGENNGAPNPDDISESDLENAKVVDDGLDKIENIDKYIDCFNDGKTAASYKMTMYVDQPVAGTNLQSNVIGVTGTIGNLVIVMAGESFDVGHTFVGFQKINTDGTQVQQILGFYPSPSFAVSGIYSKGVIKDNGGHGYDVSYTREVNSIEFTSALAQVKGDFTSTNYNVLGYNCTDAGLKWMNAADAGLPDASRGAFKNTPGDYGQELRNKSGANKAGGNAPNSKGPCN